MTAQETAKFPASYNARRRDDGPISAHAATDAAKEPTQ